MLINSWNEDDWNRGQARKKGHPVMPILQGHAQPGPEQRACYGCGQKGDHMRGDPKCPAGPNGIWEGAPEVFKDRIRKRSKGGKGAGKGKGKGVQRNLGNRAQRGDESKTPCPNWSRGNGFCKYGPACRYSHDGKKGGKPQDQKKRKQEVVFLATKKGKKARKQLSTLLIKELKDEFASSEHNKGNDEDDSSLYQLIRGVPSAIISRGGSQVVNDFVPKRLKYKQEGNATQFYVTLMMASSSDDTEGYSPKRDSPDRPTHLENLIDRLEQQQKETGREPQNKDLIDPSEQRSKGKEATPSTKRAVDRMSNLIDRASSKTNLIDRASSSEFKSTKNDLIDQADKTRRSNKITKGDFQPNSELDVFFDKFENQQFEEHKEMSSANLKKFSNSERYQLEEWKYRADVAEERVIRLQNLKELRDSQHRSNIDKLENEVKKLKAKKKVGIAMSYNKTKQTEGNAEWGSKGKRVRYQRHEENLNVS